MALRSNTTATRIAKEAAVAAVRSLFTGRTRGSWQVADNGEIDGVPYWRVTHCYAGRRKEDVEAYVRPDGAVEDIDGRPWGAEGCAVDLTVFNKKRRRRAR